MSYIVHKSVELSNISNKALEAIKECYWMVSPKYDGCHAIFCFDNGMHVGTFSRSGEKVLSMDHVAEALLYAYNLDNGRIAICGEAWTPGLPFNEISGMFRRHLLQPSLSFVPFDIVPFDYTEGMAPKLGQLDGRAYTTPYSNRLGSLLHWVDKPPYTCLIKPTYKSYGGPLDEVMALALVDAKHYKNSDLAYYDGAVLAQSSGKYVVGSGSAGEFIKIKPLLSVTVKVTGVIADRGEKTGKTTCVLTFAHNGKDQKVSTGLTQAQADGWVANPAMVVGANIEVEAMGITVNGLFREPRFKGIRTD